MRPSTILPFLLLTATCLTAQTYTVARVTFSDPGSFTQQQLESAVNVHAGSQLTATDLAAAAKRLIDTGYFDDISATIEGKLSAATIKFDDKPTPLDHMLHVGFTNFVWLSHEEIEAAIKAKFPLFLDYLPENSPHQDKIKAVLTAALAPSPSPPKSLRRAGAHPAPPCAGDCLQCYAPSPSRLQHQAERRYPALMPLVQKSVNSTAHTAYSEGPADQTTADRVLTPLLNAGYVHVSLNGVAATFAASTSHDEMPVVLSATLVPGEIYRIASLTYPGTDILSSDAFSASPSSTRVTLLPAVRCLRALRRSTRHTDALATWTSPSMPRQRSMQPPTPLPTP